MALLTIHSPTLPAAILAASNKTHVPTFVLAGMYQSGFTGDPASLAPKLQYWYNATGGTSWINGLAAYHAGSVRGMQDPHALDYAKQVIGSAQNAPQGLLGAQSIGSVIGLAGAELAGGLLSIAGAAAATGSAAAGAEAAAGAGAAGGAAGAEAGAAGAGGAGAGATAAKVVASSAAKKGLAALIGAGAWAEFGVRMIEALAGAALILLGLQALTGGSGNPVDAVRSTARRMR